MTKESSMTAEPTPSLIERAREIAAGVYNRAGMHFEAQSIRGGAGDAFVGVMGALAALQSTQAPDGFVMVKTMSEAEASRFGADRGYGPISSEGTRGESHYYGAMRDLGIITRDPYAAFFTAHPEIPDNADTRAVLAAQEGRK